MKVWIKGSIKVLVFTVGVLSVFAWIHALIYLEYFNNIIASIIGGIAAIFFAAFMFKELDGRTWFQHKD